MAINPANAIQHELDWSSVVDPYHGRRHPHAAKAGFTRNAIALSTIDDSPIMQAFSEKCSLHEIILIGIAASTTSPFNFKSITPRTLLLSISLV